MAIAKLGPVIEAISGNLGGVNFANSAGSLTVRQRQRVSKSLSPTQLSQLAQMQRAQSAWSSLSDSDRLEFRRVAQTAVFPDRLGLSRSISGYQLFLKLHARSWIYGAPSMSYPPDPTRNPPILVAFLSSVAGSSFVLNFFNPYLPTWTSVRVEAARSFSTSKPSFWHGWRHINDVLLSQSGAQFIANVRSSLGDPQTGEWVSARFRTMYQSNMLSWPYVVVAQTT